MEAEVTILVISYNADFLKSLTRCVVSYKIFYQKTKIQKLLGIVDLL